MGGHITSREKFNLKHLQFAQQHFLSREKGQFYKLRFCQHQNPRLRAGRPFQLLPRCLCLLPDHAPGEARATCFQ